MYRFFPMGAAVLSLCLVSWAQGIRMPSDLIPLEVGNVWEYQLTDTAGNVVDAFAMEITEHVILEGTSMYVFSSFPLAPDGGFLGPVAIRYDDARREYILFDGAREADLFPSVGATAAVLADDDTGAPLTVRVGFGPLALTFERGLGIIGAERETPSGPLLTRLTGARIGDIRIGDAAPTEPEPAIPVREPIETVETASDTNPALELEVLAHPDGHRFVLHVRNTSSRLLAFDFSSSQSYDFVVLDPETGQEVWRWSRRMFFSQVVRTEAVRAGGEWTFQDVWNHRDNDYEEVPSGSYEVYGVLTSEPPIESEAVAFDVP